jgi:hypothetical protein
LREIAELSTLAGSAAKMPPIVSSRTRLLETCRTAVFACVALMIPLCSIAGAAPMSMQAKGSFEVDIKPLPGIDGTSLGRMSLDKRFSGDLAATSKGEMLTAMTATKGSAGYVAVEHVEGTLNGREGGFSMQHSGTMNRGAPTLVITVVPDSGSGALTGIAGTLTIDIVEGKHYYTLDYSLPSTP